MPTFLPELLTISRKSFRLTALLILSPLFFFGQTLTGLWTGALSNDSTTVRKDQLFEIALTEYKGKVYGYSRSEFIVDDTLYYMVKRVKGTIEGDVCEVVDDEIVSYNFRGKLDKGIKVTSIFRRNQNDSSWYLDGTWKTNATKKYYSLSGKVNLEEEKDLTASKIFPHLEELKLANDIAFYKERQEGAPIVRMVKPEKIKTEYSTKVEQLPAANTIAVPTVTPALERIETIPPVVAVSKPTIDLPKMDTRIIATGQVNVTPAAVTKTIAENQIPEVEVAAVTKPSINLPRTDTKSIPGTAVDVKPTATTKTISENKIPATVPVAAKQPEIKSVAKTNNLPASTSAQPVTQNKKQDVVSTKPVVVNNTVSEKKEVKAEAVPVVSVIPVEKKPTVDIIAKAALVAGRKSEFSQIVSFKSDSLELSLYDNGEIDGDTVSIYMNGEVILSNQGLKASAIKKTIYITPANEDFTLVLFAENLGKYPPNTGLLVVHDGEDVYNLRFSSDFQKNAGIVFRRKKK